MELSPHTTSPVFRCVACGRLVPRDLATICHGFAVCAACRPGLNTSLVDHLATKMVTHRDHLPIQTRDAA
jgi:hypothetical protein